jgi:uncharacterized protein YjbI with pentapeptide repeats
MNDWTSEAFTKSKLAELEGFHRNSSWTISDFSGIKLGLLETAQTFSQELGHFIRGQIEDVNLRDSHLGMNLHSTSCTRVDFSGAVLEECLIAKAHFSNCTFDRATLMFTFCDDALFENCSFVGSTIKRRAARSPTHGARVKFTNCNFSSSVWRYVYLKAAKFLDCNFESASFSHVDLQGAKFQNGSPFEDQFDKFSVKPDL